MDGGLVSLKSVTQQIHNQQEADELVVHIHSPGGDVNEGFAIYDALIATGKKIKTIGEGLVGSIATVPFLAGGEREMTPNAEFFIHNPWGFTGGDAEDVQKYADQLKKAQDKLAAFYAEKTGQAASSLALKMNNDTTLSANEAVDMGFATAISKPLKAVAKITLKHTKYDMSKQVNENLKKQNTLIGRLLKKFGLSESDLNNKVFELEDGTLIEVDGEGDLEEGQVVTTEGKPLAEGEYTLTDGRMISVDANGIIISVSETEQEEMEALRTRNQWLKTELEKERKARKQLTADLKEVKQDVIALAGLSSTYRPRAEQTTFKKHPETRGEKNGYDAIKSRREKRKQISS